MDKFLKKKRPAEGEAPTTSAEGEETTTSAAKRPAPSAVAGEAKAVNSVEELFATLTSQSWRTALAAELPKPYMRTLADKVRAERSSQEVFPAADMTFASLNLVPLEDVRVVIIGQDPYHGDGQAHGLCFSVQDGVPTPPSLKNIYKELASDILGFVAPATGNLEAWAKQGVLLLNASLTVRAHSANSHAKFGWQTFTDAVVKAVNDRSENVVFILWGGFAQKKGKTIISRTRHCVLEAAHPSPLSVTKFRGCKVFSKTNAFLVQKGKAAIDWSL